jgi:hypothetical protein
MGKGRLTHCRVCVPARFPADVTLLFHASCAIANAAAAGRFTDPPPQALAAYLCQVRSCQARRLYAAPSHLRSVCGTGLLGVHH